MHSGSSAGFKAPHHAPPPYVPRGGTRATRSSHADRPGW